jgi:D-alanyl-D-alanine carboxypeptidase (penicillin-binding protein 5/6)
MSPLSRHRRLRLARFGLFVALAVGLGVGITTFANSAVSPPDGPRAVAEEPAASEAPLPELEAADLPWPREGAAAVAIGDGDVLTPSDAPRPMASITKLITALMVQDARPLAVGESGPEFFFVEKWNNSYEEYLARDESALPVPAGGTLTQHQLLQGMLLGSACNYADILVEDIWGDDAAFAAATAEFLAAHGLADITVTEPTGIDPANTASPSDLIDLGRLALADPVIAEIVATAQVELPGAGLVENTNDLLADPGVVGIKTGTLDGSNLLSAKDVAVGDRTVRVYTVVLSQADDEARFVASRALYDGVAAQLTAAD